MTETIPIIDLSILHTPEGVEILSTQIGDACRDIGFFYVINHGVPSSLVHELFNVGYDFFQNKANEDKLKISMKYAARAFRGYFVLGGELTRKKPDWKEGLYFGAELQDDHPFVLEGKPMHGKNLWPEDMPQMKDAVLNYMEALTVLGHLIMELIGRSLALDPNYFREKFTSEPFTPFRLFYYPPDDLGYHLDDHTERWGVGEHTDYGVITILAQDEIGGLQVKTKSGEWIEAPPIPNSFVVNIGDMLGIWTGGKYKATPHRVKNISSNGRLSAPFFFDPGFDCVIEPASSFDGDNNLFVDANSPWSKPFRYGDYIHMKVMNNFPELSKSNNDQMTIK